MTDIDIEAIKKRREDALGDGPESDDAFEEVVGTDIPALLVLVEELRLAEARLKDQNGNLEVLLNRRAARIRELEAALGDCYVLFMDIRLDWSEPKAECRHGMAIVGAMIGQEECDRRAAEALWPVGSEIDRSRCSMPGCPDKPTHFVGQDSSRYCARHYGQLVFPREEANRDT